MSSEGITRRRILIVTTGLALAGAEKQVVLLATHLKRRGWAVQVVSLTPPKAYEEVLQEAGVPVISLGMRRKWPNPWPLLRLVKLIWAWRPAIVHSHMVHANLMARLVRPLVSIEKLVCTAHNIDERGCYSRSGRLREIAYRLTDCFCDLTTQVSRAGLERYIRIGAAPANKIRYIPNGVDMEVFRFDPEARASVRKELGLEDAFVWLAVGRLVEQKDYSTLLKSFRQVAEARPEARLLIAGEGPLWKDLANLAEDLALTEWVHFLGVRRDVPRLMSAADAYVMSSAWEGMPNVLLEAASCQLPIVATDVGGNGEIVVDGETGYLVPAGDVGILAQAMLQLMDLDPEERRQMGLRGREHVERVFGIEHIVDVWEQVYEGKLDERASL